jgi:O-antigen ligase
MNLKLKDLWYWVANLALVGSAFASMYMNNAYAMLAVAIPLIFLDRAYVVPVLLFIAAIEGSFKVEGGTSSDAETIVIAVVGPILAYDLIRRNSKKVPFQFVLLYLIFGLFVVIGIFIYNMHPEIKNYLIPLTSKPVGNLAIYIKTVIKLIKIVFFFIFLKVFINEERELFYRALTLLKDMTPYLTMFVLLNMLMFGVVSEKFETLHFGESHHGDFSANMNALGIYLYIGLFEEKSSLFKRLVNIAGLGCLLYIIMELASRNGLLTFAILGCLGGALGIWNKNWGFKITVVAAAIFFAGAAAYVFKDSPTIQRFIYMTDEEGGGDRLTYWMSGVTSLKEDPLFGLGGDETSSMYAVAKYAPEVPDHVMHNTFIEYAVEYGIIGFMFYITYVSVIVYHGLRNCFFAVKFNDILLAAPSISYFIGIFAALFTSRVWESTLWYDLTLILGIYILWRKPIEDAIKSRKFYLIRGLPDPLSNPSLALHPVNKN